MDFIAELVCMAILMLAGSVFMWFLKQDWKPAKLHWRFTLLSIALALPFIACGTYAWVQNDYRGYEIGDLVYALGFPLTLIVLSFRSYAGRGLSSSDHYWAIPLIDSLFLLQWVLWGQALAIIIRLRRRHDLITRRSDRVVEQVNRAFEPLLALHQDFIAKHGKRHTDQVIALAIGLLFILSICLWVVFSVR